MLPGPTGSPLGHKQQNQQDAKKPTFRKILAINLAGKFSVKTLASFMPNRYENTHPDQAPADFFTRCFS
jgi:hypothetical protein